MIWTIFIFAIMISLLVVVHEFGHYIIARLCGVRVLCFSVGFGKKLLKKEMFGTEFSLSMIPLGGYIKMSDSRVMTLSSEELASAFDQQPIYKRSLIIAAGPVFNFIFAILTYWFIFVSGVPTVKYLDAIDKVVPDSVAAAYHLQPNDRIVAYNDHPFENWETFADYLKKTPEVKLELARGDEHIIEVIPLQKNGLGEQAYYSLGISPQYELETEHYSVFEGLIKSVENTLVLIKNTCYAFYQLLIGAIGLDNLGGPIAIANTASAVTDLGMVAFLSFLAFISINLGVINLIPLPMLDGGHLLFLLIEKIKGSPVSNLTQERFFRLGFVLLIGIMCIAFFNDVNRLR